VFLQQKNLAAVEVTVYNPALDPDGSGAKLLIELLAAAFTKRLEVLAATEAMAAAPAVSAAPAASAPEPEAASSAAAAAANSSAPASPSAAEPAAHDSGPPQSEEPLESPQLATTDPSSEPDTPSF